jgi:hypothetical protein
VCYLAGAASWRERENLQNLQQVFSVLKMSGSSQQVFQTVRRATLALSLWLVVGYAAFAQGPAPFQRLAGQWSGSGTIEFSDGRREPIKCRAGYDVLEDRSQLQFSIRCASQSYNFDLRGSATYSGGTVTGVWSEATNNTGGRMTGTAKGDRFQVQAQGPGYSAQFTLLTRGNRQSVTIRSSDPTSKVQGASIHLRRR